MQYLIEYTGKINGASYGFQPFENEMPIHLDGVALDLLNNAHDADHPEFVQDIRVTAIDIADGICADVTEDAKIHFAEYLRGNGATYIPEFAQEAFDVVCEAWAA